MSKPIVKALKRAVKLAGGQTELAAKVNETVNGTGIKKINQQHIWNWINRDKKVPAEYGIPIENSVEGQVTCESLCPTVFAVRRLFVKEHEARP